METFKLSIEGEYDSEEKAVKDLANKYMQCSKCDLPGEHPVELLMEAKPRKGQLKTVCKGVWLSVWESIYGREQWVEKHELRIYPFKPNHWWPSISGKTQPKGSKFRYEIVPPKSKNKKL